MLSGWVQDHRLTSWNNSLLVSMQSWWYYLSTFKMLLEGPIIYLHSFCEYKWVGRCPMPPSVVMVSISLWGNHCIIFRSEKYNHLLASQNGKIQMHSFWMLLAEVQQGYVNPDISEFWHMHQPIIYQSIATQISLSILYEPEIVEILKPYRYSSQIHTCKSVGSRGAQRDESEV